MTMYVDPPEGWKYGFPKPFPKERIGSTEDWLIENGYPKKLIEEYGEHMFVRVWDDGEEDSSK